MEKNKIFIGNINYDTSMDTLLEIFSEYGEVVESYRPQGKGFAFIQYATEEAAQKAIDEMHEKEIDGRALVVNIARPKKERSSGGYNN